MCGRVRLSSDVSEIKLAFSDPARAAGAQHGAELERGADGSVADRALRRQGRRARRRGAALRPRPLLGEDLGFWSINARAGGDDAKPARSEAFERRRCLGRWEGFEGWRKLA